MLVLDLTVGHDFGRPPVCDLGGVLRGCIAQTYARRDERIDAEVPIYILKMDAKDAFRRVHIEWDKETYVFLRGRGVHCH